MEKAVIWIPPDLDPMEPAAVACLTYTRRHGYRLDGIVRSSWESVRQMMMRGEVDVVVVADVRHLPPDRVPRIEVVDDASPEAPAATGPVSVRQRRPRRRR
ncbi:hypothetical protein [Micromonospora sp. NPDC004551]|uniref:hypothetical protein n=1 Tax=Micromonospora sp. NPDC004551 TaxID=3154284 RepID=UPI0033A2FCFF